MVILIAVNPSLLSSFSSFSSSISDLQPFRTKPTERTSKSSECECNVQNPAKKVAIVGQFFLFKVNYANLAL